jgi:hypothetical protein
VRQHLLNLFARLLPFAEEVDFAGASAEVGDYLVSLDRLEDGGYTATVERWEDWSAEAHGDTAEEAIARCIEAAEDDLAPPTPEAALPTAPCSPSAAALGALLVQHRRGKGLTLTRLAKETELNLVLLSDVERGRVVPRYSDLHRIAAALEIDLEAWQVVLAVHRAAEGVADA